MKSIIFNTLVVFLTVILTSATAFAKKQSARVDDYAGEHNQKNIRMAMSSKAFSWLSGSPGDNEKLAVGKSAQFFGFVALRYESGRKANRGDLGHTFYQLATDEQRQMVLNASKSTTPILEEWWTTRLQLLRKLEHYLYTGQQIDDEDLNLLAARFGLLNAEVGLLEAKACADIEASLNLNQINTLKKLRRSPELANKKEKKQVKLEKLVTALPVEFSNQKEAIFAKCFAYLTGTFKNREVVPLGQPAQFFGFVSIRHKSGRGAKRGTISKQFSDMLNTSQQAILHQAALELSPVTEEFMQVRSQLMGEMDLLRVAAKQRFNVQRYGLLAQQLGVIEVRVAIIEAKAYRKIRRSMSEEQQAKMMAMRADYTIDTKNTEQLSGVERGKQLYTLCAGCHESSNKLAPTLVGIVDRPVANANFDYSPALLAKRNEKWHYTTLDEFLTSPSNVIPGTKMDFSGLLNITDRQALINYLSTLQ